MIYGEKLETCLIVTYRCNARCYMCNTWKHPTAKNIEFQSDIIDSLPNNIRFLNITGGEPFIREDLEQIIQKVISKSKRTVISTNGYFTNRIKKLAKKYRNRIGIRISIEGLPTANDELRGMKDGFDHGIRTLLELLNIGLKDVGFGITVSDRNARDMIELYRLASSIGLEFATAVTHNSFYFHKHDNTFNKPELLSSSFEDIALELLKTNRPKNWFRSYFNMGLANKVLGRTRPLPCEVGTDMFFVDPHGNVLPCNGSDEPMIMGNLHEKTFNEIWHSKQAEKIRTKVKNCTKQCWMIGSASPAMKKRVWVPTKWIIKNKAKLFLNRNKRVRLDPVAK